MNGSFKNLHERAPVKQSLGQLNAIEGIGIAWDNSENAVTLSSHPATKLVLTFNNKIPFRAKCANLSFQSLLLDALLPVRTHAANARIALAWENLSILLDNVLHPLALAWHHLLVPILRLWHLPLGLTT